MFLKNAFFGFLLASVCYCILRFNLYVLGSDSNYVDFDPLPYAWLFFLLGFAALSALAWEKTTPPPGIQRSLIQALFTFSLLGSVNLFLFEKLNILVQFGTWGQRGMPDRPDEWYWFPLLTLALFSLLAGLFLYQGIKFFTQKGHRLKTSPPWPRKSRPLGFKDRILKVKEERRVS